MASLLRRLLIIAAALGFLVTSVGWGVAGGLKAFNPHFENQFVLTQSHKDDRHHHDGQTAHYDSDHRCSPKNDCSKNEAHQHPGGSCCASDCHIATQAAPSGQIFCPIIVSLHVTSPSKDAREVRSARLERPPKLIAA